MLGTQTGKSEIRELFSALVTSSLVSLGTSSALCLDKTHSCSQMCPCWLGLCAFAQAGPLERSTLLPFSPWELQLRCAVSPTVTPSLDTITPFSRCPRLLATPEVIIYSVSHKYLSSCPCHPPTNTRMRAHTHIHTHSAASSSNSFQNP